MATFRSIILALALAIGSAEFSNVTKIATLTIGFGVSTTTGGE